jgi:hypothetical protein
MQNILVGKWFVNRQFNNVHAGVIDAIVNDKYVLIRFLRDDTTELLLNENSSLYSIDDLATDYKRGLFGDVEFYEDGETTQRWLDEYREIDEWSRAEDAKTAIAAKRRELA